MPAATTNPTTHRRPGRGAAKQARAPRVRPDAVLAQDPDVRAARDMAWAGQHAAAIDRVTRAMPAAAGDDEVRIALLDLRAESLSRKATSTARSTTPTR